MSITNRFPARIFAGMTENIWHPYAPGEELKDNTLLCRTVEGKQIIVARSGEEVFACGAICPHQGTSMEHGWVFDDEITCPEHSWVFSLRTGALTWPGSGPRIPVYPVRIEGGTIEVLLQEEK